MRNSAFKLTFGVELEMVLVFHEQLLVEQLRHENAPNLDNDTFEQVKSDYIFKDVTAAERKKIGTSLLECYYASRGDSYIPWALKALEEGAKDGAEGAKDGPGGARDGPGGARDVSDGDQDGPGPAGAQDGNDDNDTNIRSLRGYNSEPLYIAAEVLRSDAQGPALSYWDSSRYLSSRSINVHADPLSKPDSFKTWQVVHDASVIPMQRPEIEDYLQEHKICPSGRSNSWKWHETITPATAQAPNDGGAVTTKRKQVDDPNPQPTKKQKNIASDRGDSSIQQAEPPSKAIKDADEWDSFGIELNSRVMKSGNIAHFDEIDKICELMRGRSCHSHGAKATKFCGLHVHVKPDGSDFDLPTLQNVAWLLVQYEKQIDSLFPKHRRMTDNEAESTVFIDLGSNLTDLAFGSTEFGDPPATLAALFSDTGPLGKPTPTQFLPLDEMQSRIFTTTKNPNADRTRLGFAMGPTKSRVVNFANVTMVSNDRQSYFPTLEFRQHEGVVTGYMVNWWAKFVIGLIQLAHYEKLADEDGGAVNSQTTSRVNQRDLEDGSIFDLLDDMQFDQKGIEYFDRRAAYLALTDNKYAEPRYYESLSPLWTTFGSKPSDYINHIDLDSVSRPSIYLQSADGGDGSASGAADQDLPGPPVRGLTDPFRTPSAD